MSFAATFQLYWPAGSSPQLIFTATAKPVRLQPASFALPILPSEFYDTRGREQSLRIRGVRLDGKET